MYKSSKKSVVVFTNKDGGIFDEAHFILKEDNTPSDDIITEANRIIAEYGEKQQLKKKSAVKERNSLPLYIAGLLSGVVLTILCLFILQALT